jgi:hypothetical protein
MPLAHISRIDTRPVDDLSDLDTDFEAQEVAGAIPTAQPSFLQASVDIARNMPAQNKEKCPKCFGTGRKFGGICFRCNGSCYINAARPLKTDTANVAARQAYADAKQEKRLTHSAKVGAFIVANPDLMDYCSRISDDFTASCLRVLNRDGAMSGPQIAAIRRSLAKATAAKAAVVAATPAGNGLDLMPIPAGRYAVPDGETRLKVLIRKPAAPSKWAGWVFVSDGAEYGQGTQYGRQAPGKTYYGKIEKELRAIAADPRAAAIAYGRLTGTCSVCGRKLENAASVEAGIGPICAAKEGWD